VFDLVGDGNGLAVVAGRGDEKEVGEACIDGVQFEDAGVQAFLFFTDRRGGLN